jgi:hypothetical protein
MIYPKPLVIPVGAPLGGTQDPTGGIGWALQVSTWWGQGCSAHPDVVSASVTR